VTPSQLAIVADVLRSALVTSRSSLLLIHANIFAILFFKEIARQLCLEHQLSFSKMVHNSSTFSFTRDLFPSAIPNGLK
jgi:hypothetical protein